MDTFFSFCCAFRFLQTIWRLHCPSSAPFQLRCPSISFVARYVVARKRALLVGGAAGCRLESVSFSYRLVVWERDCACSADGCTTTSIGDCTVRQAQVWQGLRCCKTPRNVSANFWTCMQIIAHWGSRSVQAWGHSFHHQDFATTKNTICKG